jgi:uncharacterized protein (TIGR02246 family)
VANAFADRDIRNLYQQILLAWNQHDAAAMASCFEPNGSIVGFDGSQVDSRPAIEAHLKPIFADHPTAAYVAKVREIRQLDERVALLRAAAGMIPPGMHELKPELNTVHTLVAVRNPERWSAALFQSTPAAWHGRPNDVAALVEELRGVMRRGLTCE